jgi:hypothetical protein
MSKVSRILRTFLPLIPLTCLGCGASSIGRAADASTRNASTQADAATTTSARLHVLSTNVSIQLAAGDKDGLLLTLPVPGTFQYTVTDQSTDTRGSWDLGIVTEPEYQNFISGRPWQGYAVNYAVNNETATTPTIPAGNYLFVFHCRNLAGVCQFAYSLQAWY